MKVYKFWDYLKTVQGAPLLESDVVCEIDTVKELPNMICIIEGKKAYICMINEREDFVCIHFIKDMPKEDNLSFKEEITCPHCGHEESDSWDASDEEESRDCDVCGSVFSYTREVEVTYTSIMVNRNENILKLS
jgi:hypothetical protein